jgi:transposase, IS30 family
MEYMEKGKRYRQLSYEERVKVEALKAQGESIRSIASALERSPNTIIRELKEKRVRGAYGAKKAQRKTYWRRYLSKLGCMKVAMDKELDTLVREKLVLGWSPERIAGFSTRTGKKMSKKAVYKFIHSRCLERYLFWQRIKKKSGPKRGASVLKDPSKKRLSARPGLVGSGHVELDFIVSRQSATVLMVVVDRHSRLTIIRRLERKTRHAVQGALKEVRSRYDLRTVTTDNDIVFRKWRDLEHLLSVPFFFTQPYHSWEKGLVENTNRWIRCFVPKKRDLATVSDDELRSIEHYLNETPRQILGYRTASEVLLASQVS